MKRLLVALVALSCLAIGCGDAKSGSDTANGSTASTAAADKHRLVVPDDYKTIQEAVDASKPGDLVYIKNGVYKEGSVGVTVETENIVLRGEDRNKVIIDGEFKRDNGIKVFSNGVAIENLTVRNNTGNGIFFTGEYNDDTSKNKILTGYRASYITAYNNGLYGLYGFNATKGQFDHSYGSGHPDSAFYIGQCNPCDALLTDNEGELNMLGYSGTNSTGVTIVNSNFHDNRSGIDPNSLNGEKLGPNSGTTMIGNRVVDNNNAQAPNNDSFSEAYGNGVVLGGVSNNIVERNLITGHILAGVLVTDLPDGFKPENNKVRNNKLSGNKFDLVYLTVKFPSTLYGNCFEGNEVTTQYPDGLQDKAKCGGPDVDLGDLSSIISSVPPTPPQVDWKTIKAPGEQKNMPDAATAKAKPATDVPAKVDLDAIKTPTA